MYGLMMLVILCLLACRMADVMSAKPKHIRLNEIVPLGGSIVYT